MTEQLTREQEHRALKCLSRHVLANQFIKSRETGKQLEQEIKHLRNIVEIVLYHHPNVDDPIDYESAYDDLKRQVNAEYEKNPWLAVMGL